MAIVDDQALNGVFRLNTDDFKHSVRFGAFNGRAEAAIFSNDSKGAPIIKTLFTETSLYQFRVLLEKVRKDVEMKPVELGFYPYDRESKGQVFRSSITIGRDEEKCIYLDFSGEKHKGPVRFYTVPDRSLRLNGNELPKQYLTELGADSLVEIIKTVLLPGAVYTKRNRNDNGNGNGNNHNSPGSSSPMGDDVPF